MRVFFPTVGLSSVNGVALRAFYSQNETPLQISLVPKPVSTRPKQWPFFDDENLVKLQEKMKKKNKKIHKAGARERHWGDSLPFLTVYWLYSQLLKDQLVTQTKVGN